MRNGFLSIDFQSYSFAVKALHLFADLGIKRKELMSTTCDTPLMKTLEIEAIDLEIHLLADLDSKTKELQSTSKDQERERIEIEIKSIKESLSKIPRWANLKQKIVENGGEKSSSRKTTHRYRKIFTDGK